MFSFGIIQLNMYNLLLLLFYLKIRSLIHQYHKRTELNRKILLSKTGSCRKLIYKLIQPGTSIQTKEYRSIYIEID